MPSCVAYPSSGGELAVRWFWNEYRQHPMWTLCLVALLVVGLVLDFTLIGVAPTTPIAGVPMVQGGTVQSEPGPTLVQGI